MREDLFRTPEDSFWTREDWFRTPEDSFWTPENWFWTAEDSCWRREEACLFYGNEDFLKVLVGF
jgi:hypothetical protein